jgi:PAS domain S-box-containing protein
LRITGPSADQLVITIFRVHNESNIPVAAMVSHSIYQSLINTSLSAFFLTDTDGTIFETNKAASDMFGYSEAELKKLGRQGIVETADPRFDQMMAERKKGGTTKGFLTGIRKNGERFPVAYSSVVVKEEDGREIAYVMVNDISEQQKQEKELKRLLEETNKINQQQVDSHALLENVIDSITDGFFVVDRNWTILFWNRAAAQVLLKTEKELVGKNLWKEFPELGLLKNHPDFKVLTEQNRSIRFREYFPPYGIWADVSVYPAEKNISVYFKDVTEVRLLRTLEKLERTVLEMNAKPDSVLEHILDFYLKEIEGIHEGMICSVLRLKGDRIYNWSSPSLPARYLDAIEGAQIGENAGSCGTAAYLKEKVVVTDIENDPRWEAYKELALREDLRSCWSFPIIDSHNRVMGTFAIYYKNIKAPSPEEEDTLERAKNLLMIILENKISVEAVKLSNQSYDMVAQATNDAIWDWDTDTNVVVRTGKGLKTLFGYDPEEAILDNEFWYKRIHTEDLQGVVSKQSAIMNDPTELYWEDEYRFLKKDGHYAYVYDKGFIIRNEAGKATRLIGATRDITERKENEALLL